jgi:hypothetical protein
MAMGVFGFVTIDEHDNDTRQTDKQQQEVLNIVCFLYAKIWVTAILPSTFLPRLAMEG